MRVIAPNPHHRRLLLLPGLLVLLAAPLLCEEPQDALARLASALSQNDSVNALSVFDPKMPAYGTIENNISALTNQSDVVCAIDVLDEKDDGQVKVLEVDWYMDVKSQAQSGVSERRREKVILRLILLHGKWKITAISPIKILDPLTVR